MRFGWLTLAHSPSPEEDHGAIEDLLAQKKAVFGLYAPANRRPGRGGAVPADAPPPKTPAELAKEALDRPSVAKVPPPVPGRGG